MSMEDYFGAEEYQPPQSQYVPPEQEHDAFNFSSTTAESASKHAFMQFPSNHSNSSILVLMKLINQLLASKHSLRVKMTSMTSKKMRLPSALGRKKREFKTL